MNILQGHIISTLSLQHTPSTECPWLFGEGDFFSDIQNMFRVRLGHDSLLKIK